MRDDGTVGCGLAFTTGLGAGAVTGAGDGCVDACTCKGLVGVCTGDWVGAACCDCDGVVGAGVILLMPGLGAVGDGAGVGAII